MANIFFISDTHWGHANILNFARPDGTRLRPEFKDVDEMNEAMVDRWNAIVRPQDKVYHLGDVAMKYPALVHVRRCNGHKRLVRGNHDEEDLKDYIEAGFEEVYGTRVFDDMILSHIPIHPDSIKKEWTNVHGHVHNNASPLHLGPKYFNVCVEYTEYRPLALEEVRQRIKAQQKEWSLTHNPCIEINLNASLAGMKL